MRVHTLVAVLLCTALAYVFGAAGLARAEDQPAPVAQPSPPPGLREPTATPATQPQPVANPPSAGAPAAETAQAPATADPVVAGIRANLADAAIRKDANAADLAALEAFYAERAAPLWVTEMGFSARAQVALFEIEKAGDWGLDAAAFDLPAADALPRTPGERASAEIKLDLAILKYARFARGGRLNPPEASELFDQVPPLRDPKSVFAEIAVADAPDAYLQSLHPKHEQFQRLRQALLKARGKNEEAKPAEAAKPAEDAKEPAEAAKKPADADRDIKRLVVNMERWRWMPENLGAVYVWNNSPEFMLYVMKDGKPIFADKTLVGTLNYATPVFTADMKTIVFNPDWIAPETVVKENVWPHLRERNWSILRMHKLQVSYNGNRIDPERVDWNRVNPQLHLPAEGRPWQQSRQDQIPLPQPPHRLHARYAAGAEEIFQADLPHDRA